MYPPPSSVGDGVRMAVKDVIALLGLGTPFIFAAATYGLFHWLDRNASAQATRAISAWLRGQPHQEIQVRLAIIAAFDRLYTAPLLRIRAFLRSAALSSIAFIAYTFRHVSNIIPLLSFIKSNPIAAEAIPIFLCAVILSDYISLFFVRCCLFAARDRPFIATFLAIVAGASVIACFYLLVFEASVSLMNLTVCRFCMFLAVPIVFKLPDLLDFMTPALLVHLWLPMFAFGAIGVRLLYPIFRAIERAQWFLKQGNRHPLRAIGMVAAVLVFAGAAIGKMFAAL
jgi:hypothetical protein